MLRFNASTSLGFLHLKIPGVYLTSTYLWQIYLGFYTSGGFLLYWPPHHPSSTLRVTHLIRKRPWRIAFQLLALPRGRENI